MSRDPELAGPYQVCATSPSSPGPGTGFLSAPVAAATLKDPQPLWLLLTLPCLWASPPAFLALEPVGGPVLVSASVPPEEDLVVSVDPISHC